jgi:hypothetical protein
MSGANSEAYASDIHIDPLVLKDGDTVLEYFQKLLEISFTLMVMMHAQECERLHKINSESSDSNAPERAGRTTHREEIPPGCKIEDSKLKWLSALP